MGSLLARVPASLPALLLPSSNCTLFRAHFHHPFQQAAAGPLCPSLLRLQLSSLSLVFSLLILSFILFLPGPCLLLMVRSLPATVGCLILFAGRAQHRAFYRERFSPVVLIPTQHLYAYVGITLKCMQVDQNNCFIVIILLFAENAKQVSDKKEVECLGGKSLIHSDLWSPGSRHSSMSRKHKTRRHVPSLREASTLAGEKNLSSHKVTTWFLPTLPRRPEGRYMSHSGGSSRLLDPWVSGGRKWTTRCGGGIRGWMGSLIVLRSMFFPLRQPLKRNERIPLSYRCIPPRARMSMKSGCGGEAKLPRGLGQEGRQA